MVTVCPFTKFPEPDHPVSNVKFEDNGVGAGSGFPSSFPPALPLPLLPQAVRVKISAHKQKQRPLHRLLINMVHPFRLPEG
jgi:hypothetical protein